MKRNTIQALVCIALLAALTGSCCSQRIQMIYACLASIKTLYTAVEMWRLDHGRYPTEQEALKVLLPDMVDGKGGPYVVSEEIPRDPWGNLFRYRLVNEEPLIDSAGPDGKFGTKDDIDRSTKPQQRTSGCMVRVAARP